MSFRRNISTANCDAHVYLLAHRLCHREQLQMGVNNFKKTVLDDIGKNNMILTMILIQIILSDFKDCC